MMDTAYTQKARAEVHKNLQKLQTNSHKFGRVNILEHEFCDTITKPPMNFAWLPVENPKSKPEKAATKSKQDELQPPVTSDPTAVPKKISKTTPSKSQDAALSVREPSQPKPTSAVVVDIKPREVKMSEHELRMLKEKEAIRRALTEAVTTSENKRNDTKPSEKLEEMVTLKEEPKQIEQPAKKVQTGEIIAAPPLSTGSPIVPEDIKREERVTGKVSGTEKPELKVAPRYAQPLKSPAKVIHERPTHTAASGGGSAAVSKLDLLASLCKQHIKQYRACRNDYDELMSHIAGVKLPEEPVPPTFFAWEIKVQRPKAKPLQVTEAQHSNENKKESQPAKLADEATPPSHIGSNSKGSVRIAGLKFPDDPIAPNFYAWDPDLLADEDKEQYRKKKQAAVHKVEHADTAGRKNHWDPVAPHFYAWGSAFEEKELLRKEDELSKAMQTEEAVADSPPASLQTPEEEDGATTDKIEKESEKLEELQQKSRENLDLLKSPEVSTSPQQKESIHYDAGESMSLDSSVSTVLPKNDSMAVRKELRRQRALGSKHRRFESEINRGYVQRSEYMDKFKWPSYGLGEGNVRCVSAYSKGLVSDPAGSKPSYHPHTITIGKQALQLASTSSKEFLKKKLVAGGIEDIESKLGAKPRVIFEAPEDAIASPTKDSKDLDKERAVKVEKATQGDVVETQPAIEADEIKDLAEVAPAPVDWISQTKSPEISYTHRKPILHAYLKRHRKIPNYFAWKLPSKKPFVPKRKVQRWRPKPLLRPENPVVQYQRYPDAKPFHPRSEYSSTYDRVGRRVLRRPYRNKMELYLREKQRLA